MRDDVRDDVVTDDLDQRLAGAAPRDDHVERVLEQRVEVVVVAEAQQRPVEFALTPRDLELRHHHKSNGAGTGRMNRVLG